MTELERIELAAWRVSEYCFHAIEPTSAKDAFKKFADELFTINKKLSAEKSATQ